MQLGALALFPQPVGIFLKLLIFWSIMSQSGRSLVYKIAWGTNQLLSSKLPIAMPIPPGALEFSENRREPQSGQKCLVLVEPVSEVDWWVLVSPLI